MQRETTGNLGDRAGRSTRTYVDAARWVRHCLLYSGRCHRGEHAPWIRVHRHWHNDLPGTRTRTCTALDVAYCNCRDRPKRIRRSGRPNAQWTRFAT